MNRRDTQLTFPCSPMQIAIVRTCTTGSPGQPASRRFGERGMDDLIHDGSNVTKTAAGTPGACGTEYTDGGSVQDRRAYAFVIFMQVANAVIRRPALLVFTCTTNLLVAVSGKFFSASTPGPSLM